MDSTFERCSHDRENPYVMINRDITRNANLSFQARGFLLYLLSHSDGWRINRKFIMKSQNIGKDKLKSMVDELINTGFMFMEKETLENGTFSFKYLVSESPRFKIIDTIAGSPLVDDPPRQSRLYKKEQEEKKEQKGKNITPISPKRGLRSLIFEKRKAWAYAHQRNDPGGGAVALEDRYVINSGSAPPEIYYYHKRHPFWEKLNL